MSEALTDLPEIDAADIPIDREVDTTTDDMETVDTASDTTVADDEVTDQPDPPADPNANLPEYRREAIANRELSGRLDRIEKLLSSRPAEAPAAPKTGVMPAADELTAEQKAVQEKFFKLFPAARNIFEKADAILRAAEVAPNLARTQEETDNRRAEVALRSCVDAVAGKIREGLKGENLRPETRRRITSAFASWAGADYANDPSKMPQEVLQRAIRYQDGDTTLFEEFAKDYLADFTPASRPERVARATTAATRSPRGGPASAPPPAAPKPPDSNDLDDISNAAFRSVRANAAGN